MFTSPVREGKAFAAEQKKQELKSRIAKLNALKMKVSPTKIITTSSKNMKSLLNKIYRLSPNQIEKKYQATGSEHFLIFIELSEQKKHTTDWIGSIRKNMEQKEKSCKKILILAKSSSFSWNNTKEISSRKILRTICTKHAYFNKEHTYVIRTKQKLDKIVHYWLKNSKDNKYLTKRF